MERASATLIRWLMRRFKSFGIRGAKDQLGPGYGAIKEVGLDHLAEAPALQVLHLDIRVQSQLSVRLKQPIAQLDIFDGRGMVVVLVEAAGVEEDLASNGAATAPECRSLTVRMLVHEGVHQITVLRHEILSGRRTVIGPHDRIEVGIRGKLGEDLGYRIRGDADVGIEEEHNFAARRFRPDVSGPRRTKPAVGRQHLRPMFGRYFERIIGRPIVHYDAFQR